MENRTDEGDGPTCESPQLYSFKMEERSLIESVINVLRSLLKRPDMTARDVYGTSLMSRALERMPCVTQGIGMMLSLIQHFPSGNIGCQELKIDEESVLFTTWEYIENALVGGDYQELTHDEMGVGWRSVSTDLLYLEEWIVEFHFRAENPDIEVHFEHFEDSAIDWYDETDGRALWGTLDSDYPY